jgi:hypothetical protein
MGAICVTMIVCTIVLSAAIIMGCNIIKDK